MDSNGVNQIVRVLEIIHSPRSTNEERRQAQSFLESIKQHNESPFWGYQLSIPDNNYDYIVRHFGLSLLQSAIARDFDNFDLEKQLTIRTWIIELLNKLSSKDPHYIKEKIAFLWVDIAKRCWGSALRNTKYQKESPTSPTITEKDLLESWSSLDKDLYNLWNANPSSRELTLIIFRTLFEDIYLLEDPIASARSRELTSLCPEVITSQKILNIKYEPNEQLAMFRHLDHGWLEVWSNYLLECFEDINSPANRNFVIKILQTLKTCLQWVLPLAIRDTQILNRLTQCFLYDGDVTIRTLATESLHALLTRTFTNEDDFNEIPGVIFTKEGIEMLTTVYQSIKLDPDDIDDQQYSLTKKLVEMIIGLTEYLYESRTRNASQLSETTSDLRGYLNLVLETTSHQSLIVSGLSLQFWTTVLRLDELSSKPHFQELLSRLLEIAANRLVNYEDFPDNLPVKSFLENDFEENSDALVFLANYRKLMDDIVRITICQKPQDGLIWLEARLEQFFGSPIGQRTLTDSHLQYKGENSESYLYGYSQFVLIEACVRGISRWQIWYDDSHADKQEKSDYLHKMVESLCERLLMLDIKDPLLLRKQVQTLVQFAPLLKDKSNNLMFRVLEKVITSCTYEYDENAQDEERENVRDLRTSCGTELNRLLYLMPESLKVILNDLEVVISNILSSNKVTDHEAVLFKSFLLVVSQRSAIDNKVERFSKIVDPELAAWSDPKTEKGLLELPWFMERLGIVKIAEYFQSRGITLSTSLINSEMDDAGRELKTNLKKHWSSVFPIRATRIFIQYSIEKLPHDSEDYLNLLKLWKPRIQPILPHILQLIAQIQAYHNPANWADLPVEVQSFVKESCTERFWQQGVSIQSKETFVEESVKAMHTLRDFADSVGHIVRYTREYAYLTIGSISELEETLYEVPNIATQLWRSIAGEPVGISLHSWRHLINLVLRNVIKNCPIRFIEPFMSELLPQVLSTIDALLLAKWELVLTKGLQLEGNEDDQTLSEEMMEEHLLRQLTAVVDRMLIDLVGQLGHNKLNERQILTRKLICSNPQILGMFLGLLNHMILFKDTRCSYNAILILRNIISDILNQDKEVDRWINDNFVKSLVSIIKDPFFSDCQSEAGYLLTTIYLSLRKDYEFPQKYLIQLLEVTDMKSIDLLEDLLGQATSARSQKVVMVSFVSNGEMFGQAAGLGPTRSSRTKDLEEAARKKKNAQTGGNPDDYTGINTLFGDD